MSNVQQPYSGPPEGAGPTSRTSGLAIASLVLGIVGLVPLAGIPFGIGAIVCAIMALVAMSRPPYNLSGKGFAITGIVLSGIGILMSPMLFLLLAILLPSLGKARELANRSYCAANLRGITQALMVYSNENADSYPVLPFAPYGPGNAGTPGRAATADVKTTMEGMYAPSSGEAGSPLGGIWLLVLRNQTPPKEFVCKSDPTATSLAAVMDSVGNYYTNFQSDKQISYSFAYPYAASSPGAWWRNTTDSSLPIVADMAPLNGTGVPARDVTPRSTPSNTKVWNSGNHQGDGENIAFGDAHVEFSRHPDVGQSNDNIYSYAGGGESTSQFGGTQAVKTPLDIGSTAPPYDIFMVPARNLNTGGF